MSDFDDTEERYLRKILYDLQKSYAKAAKPYIDRLVAIHARRPPPPIMLTLEQAQALGLSLSTPTQGKPVTAPE